MKNSIKIRRIPLLALVVLTSLSAPSFANAASNKTLVSAAISGLPYQYGGTYPVMSADGSAVLFTSEQGLGEVDPLTFDSNSTVNNSYFIRDLNTNTTKMVNIDADGNAVGTVPTDIEYSTSGAYPNADGTEAVFVCPDIADPSHKEEICIKNLSTGELTRITTENGVDETGEMIEMFKATSDLSNLLLYVQPAPGSQFWTQGSRFYKLNLTNNVATALPYNWTNGRATDMSDDGRYIVAQKEYSAAPTTAWRYDTSTQAEVPLSKDAGGDVVEGSLPKVSADGNVVVFQSSSQMVGTFTPTDGDTHVYMYDITKDSYDWVDQSNSATTARYSVGPDISSNGKIVTFFSPGIFDTEDMNNNSTDIFAFNSDTGAIARLTQNDARLSGYPGSTEFTRASMSADGSYAAYNAGSPAQVYVSGTADAFAAAAAAPVVTIASDNSSVNESQAFTNSGSFSSGATNWTATVDYGDGSGAQPLAINGRYFSLAHTYSEEGNFTVTVAVTNNYGATGTKTAMVAVQDLPFTVGAINASGSPVQINTAVAASANFSDPGTADTHTATWDWGDGTITGGSLTEANGAGTVADSHIYTAPGVYTIALKVTDDDGASTNQTFQYVSVYDPSPNTLFSGARHFLSPAGADSSSPSSSGEAKFGITAKYSGNNATGKVSLSFPAGNIEFDSDNITLLVTANGKATLRGTGAVNGVPGYSILVTGIDGQKTGGNDIRFQITDSTGNVIYDTQPGAGDTAAPTTAVTGNIVVH